MEYNTIFFGDVAKIKMDMLLNQKNFKKKVYRLLKLRI